jgi:hypothetical protein
MKSIDSIVMALTLVRIGQELGSDTPMARAVTAFIDAVVRGAGGAGP